MARVKVDEDLPGDVAVMLRAAGHDALSVVEQRLTGTPDEALWPHVQAEARVLFTADKGFGDVRKYPPGSHAGVVLFRLPRENRCGYIRLVEAFLAGYRLADATDATGAVIVVSPASIRVHRGSAEG